ncbi:MAG: hypothetical protein FD122_1322 [Stygiobacter sp.]|nr:MAG: hypothetical protein FD122_1322 [Stygiobacter sp.]KAF0218033.1 MAG: hypothetical protein FD178_267 [Ignavibacteria bacterium]
MRIQFAGIKRKPSYSPNQITNDALILLKTAEELIKLGADYVIYNEEEIEKVVIESDAIFSMARGTGAINKLIQLEKEGKLILNPSHSVFNCYRVNMAVRLPSAGVSFPHSMIVKSKSEEEYKISDIGERKIWVKRGDVHAVHREDVSLVYSDEELNFLLKEFALRGIDDAVLQEHVNGDVIKFYSVRNTNFFYWYYMNGNNHYKFDVDHLKELALKSAETLEIIIYGGDAIVSEDGSITIIDVNDWPSFAPIRDEASIYIAETIYNYAMEFSRF